MAKSKQKIREVTEYPFEVINKNPRESHGSFMTYEEAIGCVEFDKLTAYEIWERFDKCIEEVG